MPTLPKISVIVIVYKMARQAMNTLYTLSCSYQKNVHESDYEVIVVENESPANLEVASINRLGNNFRYFRRSETGVSPVPAMNFGIGQARGPMLCLMIDGARMVSPRIIEYALMAQRIHPDSLITVPGYNLGPAEQQYNLDYAYDEHKEIQLLENTKWQENGYRLFDICNLSGANPMGPLHLFMECNCIFTSRKILDDVGGIDARFDQVGGGSINLHTYRVLGTHPLSVYYFVMAGEGSFHQYHGGVTTSQKKDQERENLLESFRKQLEDDIWKGEYAGAVRREPLLIGAINSHAMRFVNESSFYAHRRFKRMRKRSELFWRDDNHGRYTENLS